MTDELTQDEIRVDLRLHPNPLSGIKDSEQEWWIGTLSVSKHYPGFSVGFGQPLVRGATFFKQRFEVDGKRGWAIVFKSIGDPPLHFTGWVPLDREADADKWIAFLNEEIEKRHAGIDSRDPHDGSASQEYEYEEELRTAERMKGLPPSKLVR